VVYDSKRRYIIPFDVAIKTLELKEKDIKKLEKAVKKEIRRL